ncbi:helicase HerA-like domain-containing protein [Micromonospora sp. CPCC 206061]|uniref:helicase HerA-like domain-containing protein n=1 Tax=Micromonospora sp. CPCC 206061 TaxID=3122410 RepID=UPI002FEF23D3
MANLAAEVRAGYAFDGASLDLGALVVDGECDATAQVRIPLGTLNRHGLVAGATGTGKTSGMSAPGAANEKISARATEIGQDWQPAARVW